MDYLLSLHRWIAIDTLHLTIHLGLRGSIASCLARLDLRCIHVWLLTIILLLWGKTVTKRIVGWRHGMLARVTSLLLNMLGRELSRSDRRYLRCSACRSLGV